jgi:hypothetical protein
MNIQMYFNQVSSATKLVCEDLESLKMFTHSLKEKNGNLNTFIIKILFYLQIQALHQNLLSMC